MTEFQHKVLKRFPQAQVYKTHIFIPYLERYESYGDSPTIKAKFKQPHDGKPRDTK